VRRAVEQAKSGRVGVRRIAVLTGVSMYGGKGSREGGL
jgi:hypothetical protein